MSKQTLVLIIILFLFTVGLLGLALNKSSYSPKASLPLSLISPAPTKNPFVRDTSLLFGNLQIVLASESAKKYLLPIIINTGANNLTVVQLELAFDPNILTDVNINPASFFENPVILINQIDNKNGRLSYVLAAFPSASESASPVHARQRGKQGEGTLATLTFQTKDKKTKLEMKRTASDPAATVSDVEKTQPLKQTSVTFLPKTFVVAEGLSQSALKSTNSAQLTINP